MAKLSSVTAFFPAYNDAGTIASMVIAAIRTLQELTDDYEEIAWLKVDPGLLTKAIVGVMDSCQSQVREFMSREK